jgi:hypothetical protein
MKMLLLFVAFFQVSQSTYDSARSLSYDSEFNQAIELIESEIPNGIPDSLRLKTMYLLAWNYKQLDQRESIRKSVSILSELIEQNNLPISTLSARIYSLRANGYGQLGNYEELYLGHLKAIEIAEAVGDTNEISRGLRNLFSYYEWEDKPKDIGRSIVYKLREFRNMNDELSWRAYIVEAWFENIHGNNDRAIELIAKAKPLSKELGLDRYQETLFASVKFFIDDRNLQLAERTIYKLLNDSIVQNSPELQYVALARLAHLYSLDDRRDEAEQIFNRMSGIEEHVGRNELKIGIYAEMAFEGIENTYELDPVFEGYKKSGLEWWAKFLIVVGGLGLLAALVFTRRYYLNPVASHQGFVSAWSQYRV